MLYQINRMCSSGCKPRRRRTLLGLGHRVLSRSAMLKSFKARRVVQRCSDLCIVLCCFALISVLFTHLKTSRSLGEGMIVTASAASIHGSQNEILGYWRFGPQF
ncbi:hypothetical protein B0H65DRAFT_467094 [Neurospora tetraspora]|uniref:Transmembrane protein n=1 Tax=Neurospora tetraspora TaxID=94610 RepID=A0AAE0JFW0_9PEZI|nr:hypothetical protein B0H65DRAFT_467094 [Neurospora tetraspora]